MMPVDGTTPLWVAARGLLSTRGDDFFRRQDKVLQTFDPEDIHDLRVSSRRMREGLALFAPCYPPGNITRLVKRVKKVTRLLGEIRNSDEADLFFSSLRDELDDSCRDDLDRLVAVFQAERHKKLKRLKAGLEEHAAGELCDLYRRVTNSPSLFTPPSNGSDPFAPLGSFGADTLHARLDDVLKLVPEARQKGNMEAQHLLRISVKHFRYRMEILSFLLETCYEELHATLKRYQDVLGKMHDRVVFAGISREAPLSQSSAALILSAIAAQQEKLFDEFTSMLKTMPFETIGERIREAL